MIDIHCHLLPGIDDGASTLDVSLEMAKLAVQDGIRRIIVTPHQLGSYRQNDSVTIKALVDEVQTHLTTENVPLEIRAGADVRIEPDLVSLLQSGEVLTLGERGRHVLLELPHELYFPLEPLLAELRSAGMVGILSHPERNRGILAAPQCVAELVDAGCLMQITSGSLTGSFGPEPQMLATQLVQQGLVHFVATDAHGVRSRRPRLAKSREIVTQLIGAQAADKLFVEHGEQVWQGDEVPAGRLKVAALPSPKRAQRRSSWWRLRTAS